MRIFETEVRLYEDILPALIRFTGGEISVPDTFYGDSDSGVLFMENLRRKGYFMVDKSVGECAIHEQKLAKRCVTAATALRRSGHERD